MRGDWWVEIADTSFLTESDFRNVYVKYIAEMYDFLRNCLIDFQ